MTQVRVENCLESKEVEGSIPASECDKRAPVGSNGLVPEILGEITVSTTPIYGGTEKRALCNASTCTSCLLQPQ